MMTLDTTNMCSHLQRKLFEEDGIYHSLWIAMQDDAELTAAARRQLGHSCVPSVASDQRSSALPNHQLHTVAAACGYDLQNHHHALADAEACAAIALYIL